MGRVPLYRVFMRQVLPGQKPHRWRPLVEADNPSEAMDKAMHLASGQPHAGKPDEWDESTWAISEVREVDPPGGAFGIQSRLDHTNAIADSSDRRTGSEGPEHNPPPKRPAQPERLSTGEWLDAQLPASRRDRRKGQRRKPVDPPA